MNGAIIRGRCKCYDYDKKLSKFSLNLEKNFAVQNQIRTISCSEKGLTDKKEINTEVFNIYKTFFEPKISVLNALIQDDLSRAEILKLA